MSDSNSPASTGSSDSRGKQEANVDLSKIDMSTVKWEGPLKTNTKKSQMKCKRRVEYQVDDVGTVTEEWQMACSSKDDQTNTEFALHSVYVDGQLVRQVDLKSKKVLKSESKYEPFDFLRYGADGNIDGQQQTTGKVPVVGPGKDDAAAAKDNKPASGNTPK